MLVLLYTITLNSSCPTTLFMVSIAIKPQTQLRLKFSIDKYCEDSKLNDNIKAKLSYDYIINALLDNAEVKQ